MMMTIEEMVERKRRLGYSNEYLAEKSGVPLGTVQKVMAGVTKSPRRRTLEALEAALRETHGGRAILQSQEQRTEEHSRRYQEMPDPAAASVLKEGGRDFPDGKPLYTIEDIEALPEGIHAELIDGRIYYGSAESRTHQKINGEMYLAVANYIRSGKESCEVYIPPFAVYLDEHYLEPDLTVVRDLDKLDEKGCHGAPDWIVEIVSPSSARLDGIVKLIKYFYAGVKEYWIIHPEKRLVIVYRFLEGAERESYQIYSFDEEIPCGIFSDLQICLKEF